MPLNRTLEMHVPVEYRVRPLLEALCVFLAVLLATFSTVYFIYAHALEAQKGEIREGLLRTANIIRSQIDPELHKTFDTPGKEFSPEYIAQEDRLMAIRFSDTSIAYIYTVIQDADGKVRFVLDPTPAPNAPEEDLRVDLLQEYDDAPPELLRAFAENRVVASDEPYSDQWGSFVSAFVPLHDAEDRLIGLVCVDIVADEYFRRLAPIKRATVRALVTAFFIAFLAASAVWFLRNFIGVLSQRRVALYREVRQRLAEAGEGGGDTGGSERQA